jgi:hypothetical protein
MTHSGFRGVVAMRPMDCPTDLGNTTGGDTPMAMDMDTPPTPSTQQQQQLESIKKRTREQDGGELMHMLAESFPAAHRSWGWSSP